MKRDYKHFPRNGNGDVLWGLRTSGDALTEPRVIDFSVIFRSKKAATEFAATNVAATVMTNVAATVMTNTERM